MRLDPSESPEDMRGDHESMSDEQAVADGEVPLLQPGHVPSARPDAPNELGFLHAEQ